MKLCKIFSVALISIVLICSTSASDGKYKHRKKSKFPPKNVIILIADGCGYNQVDAAGYYQYGGTGMQVYEHFPTRLAMSTYMDGGGYDPDLAWRDFDYVKDGATDSAAAATAMSTGEKTYGGAIGVDIDELPLEHIIETFEDLGKATGVVTSVEWTHATPAGFVAHNVSRRNYAEIGREMINDSAVDVIMGCGHPWYDADGELKAIPNDFEYVGGETTWDSLVAGTAGATPMATALTIPGR